MSDSTIRFGQMTFTHELLVDATPGLIADDETRLRALLSQALDKAFGDALGAASTPLQQEAPRCDCRGGLCYCRTLT